LNSVNFRTIWRIIKPSVCRYIINLSLRLRSITANFGLDNSSYRAQPHSIIVNYRTSTYLLTSLHPSLLTKSAIFGYYFINNVKDLSDVKIIFQIFNCKSIYNDYILTTIVIESFICTACYHCSKKAAAQKWRREKG
jgi:hypothetical protein